MFDTQTDQVMVVFGMTDHEPSKVYEVDDETAHNRSVEDYSEYTSFFRMACQLCFVANGSAALALLTFITQLLLSEGSANIGSNQVIEPIVRGFAYSGAVYASGIASLILAIIMMAYSKRKWGHWWQVVAFGGDIDFKDETGATASVFRRASHFFILLSFLAFLGGTALAFGSVLLFG